MLTVGDSQTDKLLHTLPEVLLCGAALTWGAQRSLRLLQLLVHPGQTQPGGQSGHTRGQSGAADAWAKLTAANAQRDDVGVGLLDGHAQGVPAVLVLVPLRRSSLQEQTHLPEDNTEEERQPVHFLSTAVYFLSPNSPRVSQVGGVMQRAPPPQVSLVDVGGVLEQKLAGDQRTLEPKTGSKGHQSWGGVVGVQLRRGLTPTTAWISGVLPPSAALAALTSAP